MHALKYLNICEFTIIKAGALKYLSNRRMSPRQSRWSTIRPLQTDLDLLTSDSTANFGSSHEEEPCSP